MKNFRGMVEPKEYKIPDFFPNLLIQIIDEFWDPLSKLDYEKPSETETTEKQTDDDGFIDISDGKVGSLISVKIFEDYLYEKVNYPENLGGLPVMKLRNKSEKGEGPLQKGDKRSNLIKHVQKMLFDLDFDLGDTGSEGNGIDGDFRIFTEQAICEFQATHKDWEGKDLIIDGMVGPQTADALNRSMVGIWYDEYTTPSELIQKHSLTTVAEKYAKKGFKL